MGHAFFHVLVGCVMVFGAAEARVVKGARMADDFKVDLDRGSTQPLADQLYTSIAEAIRRGALRVGDRLPSWQALASRTGVSRGTVRAAYERLASEALAEARGAAGTRVTGTPPSTPIARRPFARPPSMINEVGQRPLPFQLGVPAQDAFPFKLWARTLARAARKAAAAPVGYPDPRGHPALRVQIAAHVAVARGLACTPEQVIVTAGFTGALGLLVAALGLAGRKVVTEDPGFPRTRTALAYAGAIPIPVPVDAEGLVIDGNGGSSAAAAIVTPGQQAPLGMCMSQRRRDALLDWAAAHQAWIVEDDYLSELYIEGRPPPCLAAHRVGGRVVHVGSFSKTLTPAVRLGYIVAPAELAERIGDVAACLAPATDMVGQLAVADLIECGQLLRHMRRMRKLYQQRSELLRSSLSVLRPLGPPHPAMALAVRLSLPDGTDDMIIARKALARGLAPVPLSAWYATRVSSPALLLGVTNVDENRIHQQCTEIISITDETGQHAF